LGDDGARFYRLGPLYNLELLLSDPGMCGGEAFLARPEALYIRAAKSNFIVTFENEHIRVQEGTTKISLCENCMYQAFKVCAGGWNLTKFGFAKLSN